MSGSVPPSLSPESLRALLERTRDQPDDVVREARELLPVARAGGDQAALVGVLTALGSGLLKSGSHDEARTTLEDALLAASGDPECEAIVLTQRMVLFLLVGESATVNEDADMLTARVDSVTHPGSQSMALRLLAATIYRNGRIDEALSLLQKARQIALKYRDRNELCIIAVNTSSLLADSGDNSRAVSFLHEALTYADTSQSMVTIQTQYVCLYTALGHFDRALSVIDDYLLERSLDPPVERDKNMLLDRADSLAGLGRVSEAVDVIEQHGLHLDGGLRISGSAKDTLGTLYGIQGRTAEARTLLLSGLECFRRADMPHATLRALLNLAELELPHDPKRSLHYLEAYDQHNDSRQSESLHARALRLRSRAHAALGDYQRAYELGEEYHALQETLNRRQEQQRVEVALAELEHEHTQALARIQRDALRDARAEVADLHAHLETRVAQRTHELQTANEELRAFARSVSHYLRTPMQLILGHATMLGLLPPEQQTRSTDVIVESTERMAEVLDGLLAYATREAMPLEVSDVNLSDTVQAAWRDQVTWGREIRLEVGPLPVVRGDPAALRIVFGNLLHNAVKFMGDNPCPQVQVTAHPVTGGTEIQVRDNGVGFDPRDSTRLFGAFTRLPTVTRFEGLGLGLADVWRIVIAHGGHVRAEGRPGQGASFFVTLPQGGQDSSTLPQVAQAPV